MILLDLESSATLMDEMTLHIRQQDEGNAVVIVKDKVSN